MKTMTIDGRRIGAGQRPYVIAELSANHNGDILRALKLIEVAKSAGADAVKLQTYRADTITIDSDRPEFRIEGGLWDGNTLYQLYQDAHLPWDWHEALFAKARELGITIFSSPFDFSAIDFLEQLNAPAYKIASFEAIDLPLISRAAETGKPLIISTGLATAEEIEEAVDIARQSGCKELAVLHCVSGYPAPPEDYNLNTIRSLAKYADVVGLSDHTVSNTVAIASIGLGVSIIEKHFTLSRADGGPDDSFSLEPSELKQLCEDVKVAWSALGNENYGLKGSEIGNLKFRRSLYVVEDIKKGALFTEANVKSIRPGYGMKPKFYPDILGKRASQNIKKATPLSIELIDK